MEQIEDLYKKYYNDVYNYMIYLSKNADVSEEITQDAFYKAILGIKSFKGNSSIKTWLFSIARNTWLQKLKKDKRYNSSDDLELYMSKVCLENDFIIKEQLELIKEIVNQSSDITKRVFNLRCMGLSFTEIANELNISEVSARVIFCRIKKVIREKVEV